MTYGVGNPDPDMEQYKNAVGLNRLMECPTSWQYRSTRLFQSTGQ